MVRYTVQLDSTRLGSAHTNCPGEEGCYRLSYNRKRSKAKQRCVCVSIFGDMNFSIRVIHSFIHILHHRRLGVVDLELDIVSGSLWEEEDGEVSHGYTFIPYGQ